MAGKSLVELFEEYKKNPRKGWIANYREVCSHVEAIRRGDEELNADFVERLWTKRDVGVSEIYRKLLNKKTFDGLRPELVSQVQMIIDDPSLRTYGIICDQWQDWKEEGKVPHMAWAAIARVFAAADPEHFTSCVADFALNSLLKYLKDDFGIEIQMVEFKDWAKKNVELLEIIRTSFPELAKEDPIVLNTFLREESKEPSKLGVKPSPTVPGKKYEERGITESQALNTIFFGPPGTGKTFEISKIKDTYFTKKSVRVSKDQWLFEFSEDLKWWEAAAIALYDLGGKGKCSEIEKHPLIIAKASPKNTNYARYIHSVVFNAIASHSPESTSFITYKNRTDPAVFDKKDAGPQWHLVSNFESDFEDLVELTKQYQAGPPKSDEVKRYEFITFHQSYSYEEFIEGIRPVLGDGESQTELSYELVDGVFKRICDKASKDPDNDYAIFIDEINRGNISKIFGELITLIEEDKRRDYKAEKPNGLEVKLPYSQQPFSVPKNLHIIGTMNTADRSLALMDTALRRRFSFVEMMPALEELEDLSVTDGQSLVDIPIMLDVMNQRIEVLYDREHTLGHAFFMGAKWEAPSMAILKETFRQKIIPLLQEYFFDDWEKIRLVLGDNRKKNQDNVFVRELSIDTYDLFGETDLNGYEQRKYQINPDAFDYIESYIQIYDPTFKSSGPE